MYTNFLEKLTKKIDDLTTKKAKTPIEEKFGSYIEEELDFPYGGYWVKIPHNVHRSGEFPEEQMDRVFKRPWEEISIMQSEKSKIV